MDEPVLDPTAVLSDFLIPQLKNAWIGKKFCLEAICELMVHHLISVTWLFDSVDSIRLDISAVERCITHGKKFTFSI